MNENQFFNKLRLPGTTIHIGELNHVDHSITSDMPFDFEAYLATNRSKNLFFLAGIDPAISSRASDSDIIKKNYIVFDFDIRQQEEEALHRPCDDGSLLRIAKSMQQALDSSESFKDYSCIVLSGNGIHIYYFGTPIEMADRKEVFKAGAKSLVEEIEKVVSFPADHACINPARIFRMPGSINNKESNDSPKPVIILAENDCTSGLLDEVMPRGLARLEKVAHPDAIKTVQVDAEEEDEFTTINNIPIADVVCKIFPNWKFDNKQHFSEVGTSKQKACFVANDGNYIVHGGTDHFSSAQKGLGPFQFVREVQELSNRKTFKWFEKHYPELRLKEKRLIKKTTSDDGETLKTESKALQLLDLLKTTPIRIFLDQFGQGYASLNGDGRRIISLDSEEFIDWVMHNVYAKINVVFGPDTVKSAVKILRAAALSKNDVQPLAVRVALQGDKIMYDLGEQAVEIDQNGWRVNPTPPILFRRFNGQKPQVEPVAGAHNIDTLFGLLNIKNEDDRDLLKIFLVSSFIPSFPHPLLIIHGQKGAAKSSLFRMLKEIIDPWSIPSLPPTKDAKEFIQMVSHHWFAPFDNLSSLSDQLSDDMARVITGAGGSKRTLYTNDGDFLYNVRHIVAINGISNVVDKPDLLDRAIIIELARIQNNHRKSERELDAQFQAMKSSVLAAIFDAVSAAIRLEPTVVLSGYQRMADFSRWAFVIAEVLGIGGARFLEIYSKNIGKQNDAAIEANAVGFVVFEYMKNTGLPYVEKEPTFMLMELTKFADDVLKVDTPHDKLWPKNGNWLTRRLNEVAPDLEAKGIKISWTRTENERLIRIEKINDANDAISGGAKIGDSKSADIPSVIDETSGEDIVF